ncbi:laccase-2 [Folsomia candida]|uniref:Laccase-2 n=1 Tax=Folsomia candida TaxID=158441 RepID=A0A226E4Y7_FOLCA|nr:laccase-2 [Folsomia candida]OXA52027.1 Laccase-2 [Folsomia candida]
MKGNKIFATVLLPLILYQLGHANHNFCDYCANQCDHGPNFHYWIVEEKELSPDNYVQTGKVINGRFPGPTIRVFPHEYLVVKVENRLPVGLSIHWHGLHQEHTLASDGAEMITQHEIQTNNTFTYCMHIGNQEGTYAYHAHSRLDIIWIHGALIIVDPPVLLANLLRLPDYTYQDERVIILEQLYHIPLSELMDRLLVTGGPRPPTASLLINGKSYGKWSDAANNKFIDCGGYHVTKVLWGVTYRFRVMNLSSDKFLRFYITNHKMRVIEADGIYIDPIEVEYLNVHAAQRYSVIVTMNQAVGNYWMESKSIGQGTGPGNGAAILHYIGASDPTPLRTQARDATIEAIPMDEWVTSKIRPNLDLRQRSVYPVPESVDRNIYIDFHLKVIPPVSRFAINGHIFQDPDEPYLAQVRRNVNITEEPQVFEILEGENIQVILQNRAGGFSSDCGEHPWHLHGRFFHVVAHGYDEFEEERDLPLIDKMVRESDKNFEFRDVFVQYPHQTVRNSSTGVACGWYALRFKSNNPGIWLAHCHITQHMILGKMVVIWEHSVANPTLIGE